MVKITAEYQGDLHCQAKHAPSGATIFTDAPTDHQGKGELFSPTDLIAAALATCILTTLGILARRKGWNVEGMRVEVEKTMTDDSPRRIASLPVLIWMPIVLDHDSRSLIEKAAFTCPVHHSLHPDIEAPIIFHWPE